jgi:hypothetical protein
MVVSTLVLALLALPMTAHAGYGGPPGPGYPNGQYADICANAYPQGCTEVTNNPGNGVHYLAVLDGATDPTTQSYVTNFVNWWNTLFWDWYDAGITTFPFISLYTNTQYSCNYYGYFDMTICNSTMYGSRGYTIPGNTVSNSQFAGSVSYINTNAMTSCAQGAVIHELMLGLGYMEFENGTDPGGASADNNPLGGACWPNSYDINTDFSWYQGAGE